MPNQKLTLIVNYSEETPLSLQELCEVCRISIPILQDLVEHGIIDLGDSTLTEWQFNLDQLQRIKTALRLQHDLEVNLAGVAVILDLLDELHELQEEMTIIEKHYL